MKSIVTTSPLHNAFRRACAVEGIGESGTAAGGGWGWYMDEKVSKHV